MSIYIYLLLLLFLTRCSNSTEPENKKSVRDYIWTADTLTVPESSQTLMRSIWASSPNNVYVCGHNSRNIGQLWHYDGTKWTDVNIFETVDQTGIGLINVHGSSPDNVWVVGSEVRANQTPPPNFFNTSFIVHFNGTKWIEHKVNTNASVKNIFVNSQNDVWACGDDGIVYHYNGSAWDIDTVGIPFSKDASLQLLSIAEFNSQVFISGVKIEELGVKKTNYLLKLVGNQWTIIDSTTTTNPYSITWGTNRLYKASFNKFYSHGSGGVFEYEANQWINKYFTNTIMTGLWATSENNILAVKTHGGIVHYNGSDWKEFSLSDNDQILYTCLWINEDEAFVVSNDFTNVPQTTIIWHGK